MSEVIFFNNGVYQIRAIVKENDFWFIAKDIANCLEYFETERMTRRIHGEDKSSFFLKDNASAGRKVSIINKVGLYSCLASIKIKKHKQFKNWVISEVLPAMEKLSKNKIAEIEPQPQPVNLFASLAYEVEKHLNTLLILSEKQTALEAKVLDLEKQIIKADGKPETPKTAPQKIDMYSTIKEVSSITKQDYSFHKLNFYCKHHKLQVKKIAKGLYLYANSYPEQAWLGVYNVVLSDLLLKKKSN